MDDSLQQVPHPAVRRMTLYLNVLEECLEEGREWVSTTDFADLLGIKSIQVRKDLAWAGLAGKPRMGFKAEPLYQSIRSFLGWNQTEKAVLVGTGALGSALLGHSAFSRNGLDIVAAFDNDQNLIGTQIHGRQIRAVEELPEYIQSAGIRIAVLTVPKTAGQEVCDLLVSAGIKAIWNFCPQKVRVPPGIIVQREDLSSGLALLSVRLKELD